MKNDTTDETLEQEHQREERDLAKTREEAETRREAEATPATRPTPGASGKPGESQKRGRFPALRGVEPKLAERDSEDEENEEPSR